MQVKVTKEQEEKIQKKLNIFGESMHNMDLTPLEILAIWSFIGSVYLEIAKEKNFESDGRKIMCDAFYALQTGEISLVRKNAAREG